MDIGTRVRVDPNHHQWGVQSSYGEGTIIHATTRPGFDWAVRFDGAEMDETSVYPTDALIAIGDVVMEQAQSEPVVDSKRKERKRMKKAVREATEAIANAGFPFMKIELEGVTRRGQTRQCTDCRGNAYHTCETCTGDGAVRAGTVGVARIARFEECGSCRGEGRGNCPVCVGRGSIGGEYGDTNRCNRFIFNYLAQLWYGKTIDERMTEMRTDNMYQAFPEEMTYGRFYNDGSVDSEFTFTFPVGRIDVALDVIEAFKAFAKEANGTGKIDVRGAGMHIAVLQQGTYPGGPRLNERGLLNFKTQVEKLLPALYFLGSAGAQSRGMSYRHPQVSASSKYSAIFAPNRNCFEYRVFETCYERPEALYEFVQVIAQTLKFYADPSLQVPTLGKQFGFVNADSRSKQPVSRFFNTVEHLRILNAQVNYLKPKDVSFKKLRKDRGVLVTIKKLNQEGKVHHGRIRAEYKQYVDNYKTALARPLTAEQQARVDWYVIEHGYNHDEALRMSRNMGRLVPWEEFLRTHLPQTRNTQVTVAV